MMITAASPVGHPFASTGAASSEGVPTVPKWRACFIASAKSCVGSQSVTTITLAPSRELAASGPTLRLRPGPSCQVPAASW